MTDKSQISPPTADETQTVRGNLQGNSGPVWGNEYDHHRHESPKRVKVGANDGGMPARAEAPADGHESLPPENGTRGWVDQRTGAVHGSGSGAGGGQPGENLDADDDETGAS